MPWTPKPARERAAQALREDPARSDQLIARLTGTSASTVSATRAILEQRWLIGRVPVSQRERRPYPAQPSPVRDAIAQLPPDADYRQVAQAARVSPQAAHRMLKTAPRMGDVAAAADSLSVLKVIPLPCAHCRRPFTPDSPSRVYCRPACQQAAAARREHQAQLDRGHDRAPAADPQHPPPAIPQLPPAPDFSKGLCTTTPPAQRAWWTSEIRDEREAAARMCQGCPVRPDCTQWSLALPLSDPAIYGGMSQRERTRRRREWLAAVTAQIRSRRLPWPQPGTRLTFQYRVPGPRKSLSGGKAFPPPPARHASPSPLFPRSPVRPEPGLAGPRFRSILGPRPGQGSTFTRGFKRILGT